MKILDSKFHLDDDRIVKTSNGEAIPDDEPVFILRARDYLSIPLLRHYGWLSRQDGCTDYHMSGLDETMERFVRFAAEHPERMKQPGVTRGL